MNSNPTLQQKLILTLDYDQWKNKEMTPVTAQRDSGILLSDDGTKLYLLTVTQMETGFVDSQTGTKLIYLCILWKAPWLWLI